MSFVSFHFALFFVVVSVVYFVTPHRFRWILLLAASYYFYMSWKAEYALLIAATTLISYSTGIMMGKENDRTGRRKYLLASLIGNLGLLFVFKYFNFFNGAMSALVSRYGISYPVPSLGLLLPIGISFYTFQTLSYSIDMYRGAREPERHLGTFALYVSFFPQLVAGPIERSTRLLPQFRVAQRFDYERISMGLQLMLWGVFKKVAIADRLAVVVNQVYNHPTDYTGITLILATYFFAFQIYCDFSGYSDIAIGAAKVMGFDLMKNFDRPYAAKSVREFWKRWHISLSSWFRDYLYIPLGGSRVSVARWYLNIFVVFVVSGLWHGANWTFLAWGALHGIYLLFAVWTRKARSRCASALRLDSVPLVHGVVKTFVTFHLVAFAWILFRANSLRDAWYVVTHMFIGLGRFFAGLSHLGLGQGLLGGDLGLGRLELVVALALIALLEGVQFLQRRGSVRAIVAKFPVWARWPLYYAGILAVLLLGKYGIQEFIYFQF